MDPDVTLERLNETHEHGNLIAFRAHMLNLICWLALGGHHPRWAIIKPETMKAYRAQLVEWFGETPGEVEK